MGGFIGGGCMNPSVDKEPPPRTGLLGMLDMLQGWWWHSFLLIALLIDCGVMTWAALNDTVVIPEADLSNWNSLPLILANAHYIFVWLLFVDATMRLFTFVMFSMAPKPDKKVVQKGMLRTAVEGVGSLVYKTGSLAYKTIMIPFTPTGWEDWQWTVWEVASLTTEVMEFMVPAFYDFLLSSIALYNTVPGLPNRRDMPVFNAYLAKGVLSILNAMVITRMVKNFLEVDDLPYDFDYVLKEAYKSRPDSKHIAVPWVPPLVSFAVGLAFVITQHLEHSIIFFILGGLFILRGLLRGSPWIRELIAQAVTLMVILVVFAQFAYNCTEYEGHLGFDLSSGSTELVNEFRSDCCTFAGPPAAQPNGAHMCDSRCDSSEALIGCKADGINQDCRFCGINGAPACAAMWLGSFRGLFDMGGMPHDVVCSHLRLLGMLLILVQAVMLVIEGIFFGEVSVKMRDDRHMRHLSSPQRWTFAWIAEVLFQPNAGYEVLCYDMGILAVALCHQFNIKIPIEVARLARYFCYKTRDVIPWYVDEIWGDEMKKLLGMLKSSEATYYAERADWYVRADRIDDASGSNSFATEGMESQIEGVPFSSSRDLDHS